MPRMIGWVYAITCKLARIVSEDVAEALRVTARDCA